MANPSIIDLVPERRLFACLHIAIYAGREFDVGTFISESAWAQDFVKKNSLTELEDTLDALAERGYLTKHETIGKQSIFRYTDDVVDQMCVAMASGCTNEEIMSAPEWFKDAMRARGDLVDTEHGIQRVWRA